MGIFLVLCTKFLTGALQAPARRKQVDYGYWYEPDGRDHVQQQAFEQVEVKPQALEWLMALACGVPFEVSCDNLNGSAPVDRFAFQDQVYVQDFGVLRAWFAAACASLDRNLQKILSNESSDL